MDKLSKYVVSFTYETKPFNQHYSNICSSWNCSNLSYSFLTTERPSQIKLTSRIFLMRIGNTRFKRIPIFASLLGDLRFNNKVSSNSSEKFKSDANYERAFLDKLDKIKLSNLNDSDQLNYRLIKTSMEKLVLKEGTFQDITWHLISEVVCRTTTVMVTG